MVTWFKSIHDLAPVLTGGHLAGSGIAQGDWVTGVSGFLTVGGKAAWYLKDKFTKIDAQLQKPGPTPTPTAIVDTAMVAVAAVDLINGFGVPNQGDKFYAGSLQFDNVEAKLESANPNPTEWDGDAANSYAAVNKKLQELAAALEELDKAAQECVKDHAESVQMAHRVIALALVSLLAAQAVALVLWSIPALGPVKSIKFQIWVVATVVGTVGFFEWLTMYRSLSTSSRMETLAQQYKNIADQASPSGTFTKIGVPGADETRISSFQAISDAMSGMSAFSGTPSIASAGMAVEDDSLQERTSPGALLGDRQTFEDRIPEAAAVSGQAAKPQQINLVNQTMGSAPQRASIAQRSQRVVARTKETALTEGANGPQAASGTQGEERAPVDVAAIGPERAKEQPSANRIN